LSAKPGEKAGCAEGDALMQPDIAGGRQEKMFLEIWS
jgi:hypothetical protein